MKIINLRVLTASLYGLSYAMRDGPCYGKLHLVDLQRASYASVGNRPDPHDRTIHAWMPIIESRFT